MDCLTFVDLVKIEPRLGWLKDEARNYKYTTNESATSVWYREFKPRMEKLCGMYAVQSEGIIRSSAAYDIAYQEILSALPEGGA